MRLTTMQKQPLVRLIAFAALFSAPLLASGAAEADCQDASQSEIKVEIDPSKIGEALQALGLADKKPKKERTIYFFDTCKKDLLSKGVILRARQAEGDDDETTAKLRPMDPSKVPQELCKKVKCEEDRSLAPKSAKISCSLDRKTSGHDIKQAADGTIRVGQLFSDEQLSLVNVGKSAKMWDEVRALGPIRSRSWKDVKLETEDEEDGVAVEEWTFLHEDKPRFLEVSQRVCRSHAKEALDQLVVKLGELHIELAKPKDQEAKTTAALDAIIAGSKAICPNAAR
jgi:hypothetical protein